MCSSLIVYDVFLVDNMHSVATDVEELQNVAAKMG